MLGVEQEQFLERQLGASQAAWKVLAQQTVMTDLRVGGAVLNYDQWDGYPAAKERLFAAIDASGSASTVVLTGDIHLAGAAHLRREGAPQPLAVEFIATSISSNGNVPVDFAAAIDDVFPDVVASELLHRGYVVHTVTADEWLAEYRIVDDVKSEQSSVSTWQTFRVAVEVPLIETVS
jgi:alkaline phosphatase D